MPVVRPAGALHRQRGQRLLAWSPARRADVQRACAPLRCAWCQVGINTVSLIPDP